MTVKEAFKFYMESMKVSLGNFPQGIKSVVEKDEHSFNMKPESKELLAPGEALKAHRVAILALELQEALNVSEEEYLKEDKKRNTVQGVEWMDRRYWIPF